ncbi:MAG: hydrolase, partial [Pseudomonadota bacterium]
MSGPFRPAWWLRNTHLQTLFPTFFRTLPRVSLRRERIELPDGDFLDLDWTEGDRGPIVLVLHGLEGSSRSKYALGLMKAVHARGSRGAVMHFRGCSRKPNR